jgi:hypothetical protein
MAKWIQLEIEGKITRLKASNIKRIDNDNGHVYIDGLLVAKFSYKAEAELYIKEFMAKHFIKTTRVS